MRKVIAVTLSCLILMIPTLVEHLLYGLKGFSFISVFIVGWFTYSIMGNAEKAGWCKSTQALMPEMFACLFFTAACVLLAGIRNDDLSLVFGFVIPQLVIGITFILSFQVSFRVWRAGM